MQQVTLTVIYVDRVVKINTTQAELEMNNCLSRGGVKAIILDGKLIYSVT